MLWLNLSLTFFAKILIGLALFLFLLRNIELGLVILIASYFLQQGLFGEEFSLMKALGIIFFLIFIAQQSLKSRSLRLGNIFLLLFLFFIAMVFSLHNAIDLELSAYYMKKFSMDVALYLLIVNVALIKSTPKKVAVGIIAVGVINIIIGVYFFTIIGWTGRALSIVGNPNAFGQVSALVVFLVLPFLIYRQRFAVNHGISIAILILGSIGLSISGSRGALVAFIITMMIFFLLEQFYFKQRRVGRYILIGVLISIAALVVMPEDIGKRHWEIPQKFRGFYSTDFEDIDRGRAYLTQQALDTWRENPVSGGGIGNFPRYVLLGSWYLESWFQEHVIAHNMYLQLLAETGLIGFIIFVWAIILSLHNFLKAMRLYHRILDIQGYVLSEAFLLSALFLYTAMAGSGNLIREPIYIMFGLSVAAVAIAERQSKGQFYYETRFRFKENQK